MPFLHDATKQIIFNLKAPKRHTTWTRNDRMMNRLFLLLLIAFVASRTCAFVPTTPSFTRAVARRMVRFDGEKWIPETDDETPDAGYSIGGTLLRFGPIPAIKRVFQSDEYEQAVLKFMYSEGCDRNQAQGNMDYYTRNPNDWFAVRLKEEKSGVKKDFVSIDAVKTALTLVWGVIVLVIGAKLAFQIASGELDLFYILLGRSHQWDFLTGKGDQMF